MLDASLILRGIAGVGEVWTYALTLRALSVEVAVILLALRAVFGLNFIRQLLVFFTQLY